MTAGSGRDPTHKAPLRITYLCLQGTSPGQASHTHVHAIVRGLRAAGFQVDLFEPRYRSSTDRPRLLGRLLPMILTELRVISVLPRTDVLYVRHHVAAFAAVLAALVMRKPVVQEANGPSADLFLAWPQIRPLKPLIIWLATVQYRWSREVIAVTPGLGRSVQEQPGRHRVTVIPNGADVELFHPGAISSRALPRPYVVFFGALATWQGIATMLAATEHPEWPEDVHLVVAGDGALRADVERAARAGRVAFLGNLPQAELPGIVAESIGSLIVKDHPAHATSGLSPLKLYESMAAGVPIVVSALPGLEETVRRFDCGIVVPAADPGALARAVRTLGSDPNLRKRLGRNGRRAAVAEFSWDVSGAATVRVVERALSRAD